MEKLTPCLLLEIAVVSQCDIKINGFIRVIKSLNFYHLNSYASMVLGVVILFVCPFVCLSVTCTADILIPHKRQSL